MRHCRSQLKPTSLHQLQRSERNYRLGQRRGLEDCVCRACHGLRCYRLSRAQYRIRGGTDVE